MNKEYFKVFLKWGTLNIFSKYVIDKDDFLYFYDREEQSDLDQPITMISKDKVKRIMRIKE